MLHIDTGKEISADEVIGKLSKKKKIVEIYFINLSVDKNSFVKYTVLFFSN